MSQYNHRCRRTSSAFFNILTLFTNELCCAPNPKSFSKTSDSKIRLSSFTCSYQAWNLPAGTGRVYLSEKFLQKRPLFSPTVRIGGFGISTPETAPLVEAFYHLYYLRLGVRRIERKRYKITFGYNILFFFYFLIYLLLLFLLFYRDFFFFLVFSFHWIFFKRHFVIHLLVDIFIGTTCENEAFYCVRIFVRTSYMLYKCHSIYSNFYLF